LGPTRAPVGPRGSLLEIAAAGMAQIRTHPILPARGDEECGSPSLGPHGGACSSPCVRIQSGVGPARTAEPAMGAPHRRAGADRPPDPSSTGGLAETTDLSGRSPPGWKRCHHIREFLPAGEHHASWARGVLCLHCTSRLLTGCVPHVGRGRHSITSSVCGAVGPRLCRRRYRGRGRGSLVAEVTGREQRSPASTPGWLRFNLSTAFLRMRRA